MSGLEIAGVLLGAFPLIISGLEHWRDVAKVGGFYWRVRKEYTKCRSDVEFHELVYKRNLKELLLPILSDTDEVNQLVSDPGGEQWTDNVLQTRLEERLLDSYALYMGVINEMIQTAEELKKELGFNKTVVQSKLVPSEASKQRHSQSPQPPLKQSKLASAKSKLDYEAFRLKFSFSEPVREELFGRLKECNSRLERLLNSSDRLSALQAPTNVKKTSALDAAFRKAWKKSDLLFKAIQAAWQCSCQHKHFANLRLEHRTLPEIYFEVILMFMAPSTHGITHGTPPWLWREMHCGHLLGCSVAQKSTKPPTTLAPSSNTAAKLAAKTARTVPVTTPSATRKAVVFSSSVPNAPQIELDLLMDPTFKLCQSLSDETCGKCMGIIGHDGETYHLHPFQKRPQPEADGQMTLNHILSHDFEGHLSRRQRYSIALLLASSVAQLQFTPWLRTGLTKEDVLFFPSPVNDSNVSYGEPFIRKGFSAVESAQSNGDANDCNLYSLGILLLELCFGKRLEDHPLRKKHPAGDEQTRPALDLMAALQWSKNVADEGGDDYASAVKWCFTGSSVSNQSWRGEIIRNVIQPLETCQEHFRVASRI
jgi:hypothetical protein